MVKKSQALRIIQMEQSSIRYQSKYYDKKVTALQYIVELLCEKKAEFDKETLPNEFWEVPRWGNYAKRNLRRATALIKHHGAPAIINMLNGVGMKGRYSIFTEYAESLIIKEKKKLDDEIGSQTVKINRNTLNSKPRQQEHKTALSKLKELDG